MIVVKRLWSLSLVTVAVVAVLAVQPGGAEESLPCVPEHTFLGDYPRHRSPGWSDELQGVAQPARKVTPWIQFCLDRVVLLHDGLRLRGITPKIRRLYFFFKFGKFDLL